MVFLQAKVLKGRQDFWTLENKGSTWVGLGVRSKAEESKIQIGRIPFTNLLKPPQCITDHIPDPSLMLIASTASQSALKLLGTRVGAFVKLTLEIESFKCILVTNVVMDSSRRFWIWIRSSNVLSLDTFIYSFLDFFIFQCMLAFNSSCYVVLFNFSIHIHILRILSYVYIGHLCQNKWKLVKRLLKGLLFRR